MGMVASAEPPRTVKSSPSTITGWPSILARPMTQLAGVSVFRLPASSYSALPAMAPTSWKLPAIDKALDALAHREPAALVLAPHLVGAAHLARHALALSQLVELALPTHVSAPRLQSAQGSHAAGVGL